MQLDFKKNLSTSDGSLRFILSLMLIVLVWRRWITGFWSVVAVMIAIVQFIEVYFSY